MNDLTDMTIAVAAGAWVLGMLISYAVQFRWANNRIRQRVEATGRPVSGPFALALMVWAILKAMFWPLTLAAWATFGQARTAPRPA